MSGKLLVFGGTGSCGAGVVQRAVSLSSFSEIVAVVRNVEKAEKLFGPSTNKIQVVQASLDDGPAIVGLLKDADYVCSAVASFAMPHVQMSTLTAQIIASAKERSDGKPKLRYICYGLCGLRADSRTWTQSMIGFMSSRKFGPAIDDHQRQMKLLEDSRDLLEYSVFGTCTMVNKPLSSAYVGGAPEELNSEARLWNRIGILDAADLVLKRIQDRSKELPPILDIM